jgi:hypothetical protein
MPEEDRIPPSAPTNLRFTGGEETARPVEAMLRDPLSDVGRKERRSLLAVAMVAILVGKTGLVPEKIENLGITFTAPERAALLWVFMAVVGYYTLAFLFYSMADFLNYLHAVHVGAQEIRRQQVAATNVKDNLMKPGEPDVATPWRMIDLVFSVSMIRGIFDFGVPLVVAIYAVVVLWGATHATTQPKPLPRADAANLRGARTRALRDAPARRATTSLRVAV